jgi:NAD(P)-dependent dehydrogenase (short-subunit alcohol dehydrogenase family)
MFYFRSVEHVSVAIVTGGTKGIGRVIAERLVQAGAQVIVCARHEAAVAGASFVEADVRDAEAGERVVRAAVEKFGRLDLLVNNAGGSPSVDAATASPRFSTAIIQLNLTAPLLFAQAANRVMQAQPDGGLILNIASISGLGPCPRAAAYAAAKAGLINLTQSLAVEWAPKVRVNAISPGLIRTEQAHLHYGDAAAQARVAATIPLGRLGEPADVADACLLLASPLSRWVSGANFVVHGGGERPTYLGALSEAKRDASFEALPKKDAPSIGAVAKVGAD